VPTWLKAVESLTGPLPPELRHLCLTLARLMDGENGCFHGTIYLAERIGVHRATVSRWLHRLRDLGWLEIEERRTQFGRTGGHYFPALPMAQLGAPIPESIGAPECANPDNGSGLGAPECANAELAIGARPAGIGARLPKIGAPECARLLTDSRLRRRARAREEGAASPSPGDPGSAAPELDSEQIELVHSLYAKGFTIAEIVTKYSTRGFTFDQVAAIVTHLERAELQAGR